MLVRLTQGTHYLHTPDVSIRRVAVGEVFEIRDEAYSGLKDRVEIVKTEQAAAPVEPTPAPPTPEAPVSTAPMPEPPAPVAPISPPAELKVPRLTVRAIEQLSTKAVIDAVQLGTYSVAVALAAERRGKARKGLINRLEALASTE